MDGERGQVRNDAVAGWVLIFVQQFGIVVGDLLRNGDFHLCQWAMVVSEHLGVDSFAYVKHDVVVVRIAVVTMAIPVAGAFMNLHVAHPHGFSDSDLRVKKIRTGMVTVVQAGVDDLHFPAVGRCHTSQWQHFVAPDVVQQLLHVSFPFLFRLQKYEYFQKYRKINEKGAQKNDRLHIERRPLLQKEQSSTYSAKGSKVPAAPPLL